MMILFAGAAGLLFSLNAIRSISYCPHAGQKITGVCGLVDGGICIPVSNCALTDTSPEQVSGLAMDHVY